HGLEAAGLEAIDDLADDALLQGVGLEDGKGAFDCHVELRIHASWRSANQAWIPRSCRTFWRVRPSTAGLGATVMPADSMARILSSAEPWPPEMIAPAWPMRLPGGAVRPAMKPTTGLVTCSSMKAAARSSAF